MLCLQVFIYLNSDNSMVTVYKLRIGEMRMDKVFEIPKDFVTRHYADKSKLPDYRTQFMRDRDRILYCTAFRRLAGKTQIYTIGNDDHKRNRLTHTLEVAQIARTIAVGLGLNCDLAEAMALGHDLGHSPFGHAGEEMLNQIMVPESNEIKGSPFIQKLSTIKNTLEREMPTTSVDYLFGYKHNLQSVRVAAVLEDSYRDVKQSNIGLNLTNYTLWGIMHHAELYYNGDTLYPNYQNQFESHLRVRRHADVEAWSFEGYVVRIADLIAQYHHDLEDAYRGRAIPVAIICETIQKALGNCLSDEDSKCLMAISEERELQRKCLAELSHIVVNSLVSDVVKQSSRNLEIIKNEIIAKHPTKVKKSLAKLLYSDYEHNIDSIPKEKVICFSNSISIDQFNKVIRSSVHHAREVGRMNVKGQYIIKKLFQAYYKNPQQLPDGPILHFMVEIGEFTSVEDALQKGVGFVRMKMEEKMKNPKLFMQCVLMRRICDHIACMTDRYAIEEYNNLYG